MLKLMDSLIDFLWDTPLSGVALDRRKPRTIIATLQDEQHVACLAAMEIGLRQQIDKLLAMLFACFLGNGHVILEQLVGEKRAEKGLTSFTREALLCQCLQSAGVGAQRLKLGFRDGCLALFKNS